jgi:hypothetical protein
MKISEVKAVLLGMLVFLLVLGSWFVYHQITRTDKLLADEILIPTDHGVWKRNIFFVEESTKNFDVYKVKNENKLFPDFYRASIPEIKPETQRYLDLRNEYIKKFEKIFLNTTIYNEWGTESIFLKPFDELTAIKEILPVTSNGKDRILVIGLDTEEYYDSNLYLLDTNYQLLDQVEYHGFMGKCVISVNFLNKIWLQINGGGGSTWTLMIDQLMIENDQILVSDFYRETEYEVEDIFDTFKVTKTSTDPTLMVYDKGKSDFWFFVFLIVAMPIVDAGSIILSSPIFLYFLGLIILFYLLYRYRKKITQYFRKILKKQ